MWDCKKYPKEYANSFLGTTKKQPTIHIINSFLKYFKLKKKNVKNLNGKKGHQMNKDSSQLTDWQECGGVAQ